MSDFQQLLRTQGSNSHGEHLCEQVFGTRRCKHSALRRFYEVIKFPIWRVLSSPSLVGASAQSCDTTLTHQSPPAEASSSSSPSTSTDSLNSSTRQARNSATSITGQLSTISLPLDRKFIPLGVNGQRRTLDIEHSDTLDNQNDIKFFHNVISSYNLYRSWQRRWFSIWQLR